MNDYLCIHEQYPSTCRICTPPPKQADEPVRTFKAKYPGQCPACNLPIHVGDVVAWRQDRPAIHASCYSEDVTRT